MPPLCNAWAELSAGWQAREQQHSGALPQARHWVAPKQCPLFGLALATPSEKVCDRAPTPSSEAPNTLGSGEAVGEEHGMQPTKAMRAHQQALRMGGRAESARPCLGTISHPVAESAPSPEARLCIAGGHNHGTATRTRGMHMHASEAVDDEKEEEAQVITSNAPTGKRAMVVEMKHPRLADCAVADPAGQVYPSFVPASIDLTAGA
eukprot:CAMPEP_0181208118 /NCGR_PEP_ID=MMETSP1096-20121128/21953_1 /TAXON_ID=156174 ORGANISM="Chrysochromulina ericina, Strain CCMP281" /NCGR_SAMPLE_ID=MMETSP1096 /ASSEMBLY_ACC=CAM_ASM_000453 /LENGTH=206 /DNA_ID=CAMNT_0023299173 /DNA_START=230 /DNA_END=851 /DNA_ORIENTATION=+